MGVRVNKPLVFRQCDQLKEQTSLAPFIRLFVCFCLSTLSSPSTSASLREKRKSLTCVSSTLLRQTQHLRDKKQDNAPQEKTCWRGGAWRGSQEASRHRHRRSSNWQVCQYFDPRSPGCYQARSHQTQPCWNETKRCPRNAQARSSQSRRNSIGQPWRSEVARYGYCEERGATTRRLQEHLDVVQERHSCAG